MICRTAVVIALGLPVQAWAQADAGDYFLVTRQTVACVSANLAALSEQAGPLYYVVPKTCPEVPANVLSLIVTNEAPDLSITAEADGGVAQPDPFLFVTRAELDCLAAAVLDAAKGLWRFYPASCRFEAAE